MEPREVLVGEKVCLPDWFDPSEGMLYAPVMAEVITEHKAFSTHTLAKVSWSVARSEGGGKTRQSRLLRIEDLKPT